MTSVTPTSPAVPTTISNLPAAASVGAGDLVPIVQGGVTKSATPSQLALAGNVTKVSNTDGTLTISPTTGNVVASLAALTSGDFLVGNGSNVATGVAMSGDATLANTGAVTLASTAVTAGSYTNTSLTVDAKGRITAASTGSTAFLTLKVQEFTGGGTYTPSTGMLYCIVEAVGGGGGGGGAKNGGSGTARGGGGGAGSYARKILSAATVGASQTVTIGAAGTAGSNAGGNGGDGGATSLGSLVTTNGGKAGSGQATSGFAAPGNGGASGTGDLAIAGQAGQPGFFGGQGGFSPLGFGYSGQLPTSDNAAGTAGSGYGAGGTSGHDNTNTGFAGATGTAGYVIITEFCSQ